MSVVVLLIVSSICAVCTSRVSNWCSNLSIRAVIWRKICIKITWGLIWLECDVFNDVSMYSMILFPDSSTSERNPCFSPLQPWISWPSNRSHISQHGKQKQCGTDFKAPCFFYLFHRDSSLDSWGHCIHPSTHSQEIQRLVFLSDGILCVDSRHFHISLLDSLEDTQT